jgi:hypothetical protein
MSRFPLRSAYPGPVILAGTANASFVARALFDGWIVFTRWPVDDAVGLLPSELELVLDRGTSPDHPVAFILGEQRACAVTAAGFSLPTGARYHEFGMMVPFVRHRGGRHVHIYVARMYASYFPAIWSGNMNFGFGKEPATFTTRGDVLVAEGDGGEPLVTFEVQPLGPWQRAVDAAVENLDAMRAVFELPVLGRREDGSLVTSYFGWDFADATVRAGAGAVGIHGQLVAGLAPRRCPALPGGAFEVQGLLWRLSWPGVCRF